MHRISQKILDAAAVERKYGVAPRFIPDFSPWSATPPTAIPESRASARWAPRAS
jgi:hypothetical protein